MCVERGAFRLPAHLLTPPSAELEQLLVPDRLDRHGVEIGDEVAVDDDFVVAERLLPDAVLKFFPHPVHGPQRHGLEALGQRGQTMLLHVAVFVEQVAGNDDGLCHVVMARADPDPARFQLEGGLPAPDPGPFVEFEIAIKQQDRGGFWS